MSSKQSVSRYDARSRSVERQRSSRAKSKDLDRSRSRSKSKHKSSNRDRKSKHKKSKKKKKSRSSSSSSSSSDSEEEELKLLQRLEAERLRLREEKKKQKELLKANETPEEKRARRLREKQEKERKRRERMGWDNEYQCYTNQDNPFGDSALTHTFVWSKKLAKEGVRSVSRDELEALNRQKQMENKIELEKVKQRRLEREAERAAREAEAAAAARAREAAQFHSWARHEDAFHLHQARLRSQIRIRDGRAKPIDLLAWYVSSEQCVDALEMHEPYTYLNGLHAQDLEDLLEDIKVYKELEQDANQSYWEDVQTIVLDELSKLRRLSAPGARRDGVHEAVADDVTQVYKELEQDANQSYWEDVQTIVLDELSKLRRLSAPGARRDGVHEAVADDVTQIFKGKTGAQLEELQAQIEHRIGGKRDGVDVPYWESLLSQLKAHMARARLRDRHQENLRRKLQLLKREQGVQPADSADAAAAAAAAAARPGGTGDSSVDARRSQTPEPKAETVAAAADERSAEPDDTERAEGGGEEEEAEAWSAAQYAAGGYSPVYLAPGALEPATLLTEPADDAQRLAYLRARLHAAAAAELHAAALRASQSEAAGAAGGAAGGATGGAAAGDASTAALTAVAQRSMAGAAADGNAAQFSVEQPLPDQPCLWADKYRPRKPRYFNRVHTGFEWNKYNQTHYDMDNPPPKIVQGYKFNIFYPDLIDKNATPEFSLKPCPENPEFAVLRFHAGPPYEDIAFKIVNREWEYSYKRGFRCHFHNNIFQLWFHFKRYRYRR